MKSKILFFLLFAILLFFSCKEKESFFQTHEFTAERLNGDSKESNTFLLSTSIGHLASDCPNGGCVYSGGRKFHVDCMGYGNECAHSTIVSLSQISGNDYTATTLDSTALTNEDFFNMPSRSLFVEYDEKNNEVWLNIPAQLVYRDSVSRQFTFTGLYYSNSQIYANN